MVLERYLPPAAGNISQRRPSALIHCALRTLKVINSRQFPTVHSIFLVMGCGKSAERISRVVISPVKKAPKDPLPTATLSPYEKTEKEEGDKGEVDVTGRPAFRPGRLADFEGVYKKAALDQSLRLEFVYGYRCFPFRQNLYYLSTADLVVYPCGSVIVLLSISSNTQKFLGGGEVNVAKGHFGDITSLCVSSERDLIATGESSAFPTISLWKLPASDPILSIDLPEGSRGTALLSFSADAKLLVSVDLNAEATVRVHETATGALAFAGSGRGGEIRSVCWSPVSTEFVTTGLAHFALWSSASNFARSDHSAQAELTVARYMPDGVLLTGTIDGRVIVWSAALVKLKECDLFPSHCCVTVLTVVNAQVIVGGREGKIKVLDTNLQELSAIDTPGVPVSVDAAGSGIVCGVQEGVIVEFGRNGRVVVMDGHSEGEISAIAIDSSRDQSVLSVAGDNKVKCWDIVHRRCATSVLLEVQNLSKSCALAVSPRGHVAIAHEDGHLTVRMNSYQLNNIVAMSRGNGEKVTTLRYSPDNTILAAGTVVGTVCFYSAKANYSFTRSVRVHQSAILSLDWSESSAFLRCQDSALCMSLVHSDTCTVATAAEVKGEVFDLESVVVALGTETKPVCRARHAKKRPIAQGTENGVVELIAEGQNAALGFKAHSREVRSIAWSKDGQTLLTAGGADMTIMQWRLA